MKKFILSVITVVYAVSFIGCAEYKVSDITKGLMTMNANGQKEIQQEKQKAQE